jgi:hypothetical protein
VHDTLVPDNTGIRKHQNALINQATQETVYIPPPVELVPDYIKD